MDEAEIRRKLCEILGVQPNATDEEIKKAYAAEVKKWHPDRVQHNSELAALADQKLKLINQTYECLTDRLQFDMYAAKLVKKQAEVAAGSDNGFSKKSSGTASGKTSESASNNGSSTESTSNNGSSTNSNSTKKASTAPPSPQPMDTGGIVKIFLAMGLFVLIVIAVANLTSPSREAPPAPGVVLSPSQSPAAPISNPASDQPAQNTLPPDSSVGPPPSANQ